MNAKDRKIFKTIVEVLKSSDNYEPTDNYLISDLVDWISIVEFKKKELRNDPGAYNIINNLSAACNQVQALMKLLSLTPQGRLRGKQNKEVKSNDFDLTTFMKN